MRFYSIDSRGRKEREGKNRGGRSGSISDPIGACQRMAYSSLSGAMSFTRSSSAPWPNRSAAKLYTTSSLWPG